MSDALSPSELNDFRQKGYLLRRRLFPPDTMRRLSAELEGLHERMDREPARDVHLSWETPRPGRPRRIRQLMNSENISPTLDAMSRSSEILDVMQQLIGPDVLLFHSKLLMKAAGEGTFTPWHQDFGYWQDESREPTQVNCQLAIDPADADNGCLRMVPGSHHEGLRDHKDFKSDSFKLGFEGGLDAFPHDVIEMEPGDAVFFGPLIIHGSGPNTSSRDRRANTFAYDKPGNRLKGAFPPGRLRRGAGVL